MSLRSEFEGDYEERERKLQEAVSLLREKFGTDLKIKVYNPKTIGDYLLVGLLPVIETALRQGGREAAHKFVDYIFNNLSKEESK